MVDLSGEENEPDQGPEEFKEMQDERL